MNMYQDLLGIDLILRSDVDLWKLLYYPSTNIQDDPLDKPDVLSLPPDVKYPAINLRLKHTPVTEDLVDQKICRIIFFPSPRRPQRGNYKVATQEVDFEIFVHRDFNDTDMRLAKLCDRVNELFSNKRIAGMGKAEFVGGKPFMLGDKGYIGYRLTYSFGSVSA